MVPFWDELAKVESDQREKFMEEQGWRMPLALRAEVSSGLKLTAFLAAVRGFVEQAAPGMLNWESLTYNDQPYVKITPTERAIGQTEEIRNLAVYYSASGKSFVVSLNEDVLKRAIDREIERGKVDASGKESAPPAHGWIGSNLALQVDQKVLQVLATLGRSEYQTLMQTRAWSNLPILNEWKHRYPDQDPVGLHERVLANPLDLSRRWPVRVERAMADDGIDRVRMPSGAQRRSGRGPGVAGDQVRQLRRHV